MWEIFETRKTKRAVRERYKINLEIPRVNQINLEIPRVNQINLEIPRINQINLEILRVNQASFRTRSLRFYGAKIWNSLPYHIKSAENLCFKNVIKSWNGLFCNCKICTK